MSGDEGADGRPGLDGLVERARADLRGWTDRAEGDPGVALLELFALVGDLLASHTERLADEGYLGSAGRSGAVGFGDGVHGRRPPSGSLVSVRRESAAAYSSVVRQQGRAVLDDGTSQESPRTTCGLYRATVLDNVDPLSQQRLRVQIPEVSGQASVWAAACLPAPGATELPDNGAGVWIALESGDPSRPVWLGHRVVG